jgi:hypothetical protein
MVLMSCAVVALIGFSGCGKTKTPAKTGGGHAHAHGHGEKGPHGGNAVELGKGHKYHVEMVDDDDAGSVSIYILDGELKKEVPIEAAEITLNVTVKGKPEFFKLAASGAKDGKASRFDSTDKRLFEIIEGEVDEKAKGRLSVTIGGEQMTAEFKSFEHEHEHKEGEEHKEGDDHDDHKDEPKK